MPQSRPERLALVALLLAAAVLPTQANAADAAGPSATDDPLAVLDGEAPAAAAAPADPLDVLTGDAADDDPAAPRGPLVEPPPVGTVEVARRLWQRGEIDEALVALKVALRDNPLDQDALLLLAELQLARMQGAAAEATLRRALDARTPRERVLVPLARAMNLQGRQRALLGELTPGDDLDGPTRARLLTELARARIALGEATAAATLLDAAMATTPEVAEPDVGRAVLALLDGHPDQARTLLDSALRKDPDHYQAWLLLGDVERRRGRLEAAETAFGEAIARSPDRWLAAFWRAVTRLDRGDLAGAEADIAVAEAQFPEFVGLVYARGRAQLLAQRPTEAAQSFERYLGANPADADALFYAAFAANQLGNREQALGYLTQMQGVEGASERLLWLKAKTLMADGDYAGAEALLRAAVAAEPPPLALVLLAQEALLRTNRADAALALVQRALVAQPDARDLLAAEARLRFAAGERAAATAAAQRLLERDPDDVDALLILGEAAALDGAVDRVLLLRLRQARERAPSDLRVPTLLGELHAAAGDLSLACGALADALRIDPTSPMVISRLQRLRCAAVDPALIQAVYRELLATRPDAVRALPALLAMNPGAEDAGTGLERLREAVAADPRNAGLRASLILALLQLGRAEAVLAELAAIPPEQLGEPELLRARGLAALARDDDHAAVNAFKDRLAVEPDSAEAALLLAEAQARQGDLGAARYHLVEGLRRAPQHPLAAAVASRLFNADDSVEARRRLIDDIRRHAPDSPLIAPLQAETLLAAGHPDKAADLYQTMFERAPDNPRLFLLLLRTRVAAGQLELARELAAREAARFPADAAVALTIGDLHATAGDQAQAGAWYRQALARAPDNPVALNNLAVILTVSDPAAAVELAERAWRQQPREPQIQDTYGVALLAAGQSARARELLTEAYGASGDDPTIGLNLARALVADGDLPRARALLLPLTRRSFPGQVEAQAMLAQLGGR